jgi:hypothetical protein
MLSKCANPVCSVTFRYLHEGRIFQLVPGPAVEWAAAEKGPLRVERFWLCDACSKEMNVIWDGARAKVVRWTEKEVLNGKRLSPAAGNAPSRDKVTQDKGTQGKPSEETPTRKIPKPASLGPTRLHAAFAGRRSR